MTSQKYAAFDPTGKILAFYAEDVTPVPPGKTAIKITDEEWQAALKSQKHTVQNGKLVAPVPPTPEEVKAEADKAKAFKIKGDAKAALKESDVMVLRAYEAQVPVAPEWVEYRNKLREVVTGKTTELPDIPTS